MWYAENVSSPATKILNEKTHLNSLLLKNENLGDSVNNKLFFASYLIFSRDKGKNVESLIAVW